MPSSREPEFTVAIPTCNGERHLREAIASVLAQTGVRFDLIICDDRSEDKTIEIVRELAGDRARIEVNSERLGLAGNWNRCVALSRTDWVSVFHQDDVMKPWHLAVTLNAIESSTRIPLGFVAGDSLTIDDSGLPIDPRLVDPGGNIIQARGPYGLRVTVLAPGAFTDYLIQRNPIRCSTVTLNREAHADVGGFDAGFRYVVDWEFWLRVARRWGVAWRSGDPSVLIRWHPSSETHRFKTGTTDLDETLRLLTRISAEDVPGHPNRQAMRREADYRLARAFLNRALEALHAGQSEMARDCLSRGIRLSPSILTTIASDLRLAPQMAALTLAPKVAERLFSRPK
jgi:GT2 family glycosyltransferase